MGLGHVALARGRLSEARAFFDDAIRSDPRSVDALLGTASVAERLGRPDVAVRAVRHALQQDNTLSDAHARMAALTGRAPHPSSDAEALELAHAHPYDPRALVTAARVLAARGAREEAVGRLEDALWVADLDPAAAREALALLARWSPEWRERRVIEVFAYVDELLRAREGWRFQQRTLWLAASNSLGPLLDVRFLPLTIRATQRGDVGPQLEVIFEAFRASAPPPPGPGIVAILTGAPLPSGPGVWKRGLAEFLGRRLAVRIEPGAIQSRVLIHELLHLWGGVHVSVDVDTIMNPDGHRMILDPMNQEIVRATRNRAFGAGGFDHNVLPHIDLQRTIDAYLQALTVNFTLRKLGLERALVERSESPRRAAERVRRARFLDPHLADTSAMVGVMLVADGRPEEAALLFDTAAVLYGSKSDRGRAAAARAESLRIASPTLER